MKNFLLASTMLVATATIANAQVVTITGEGRMGVQAFTLGGAGVWAWSQESRLRLDFSVAVEADHGLTFGAWTRAQMASVWPGAATAGGFSPARVWVESNSVRLTFGNSDGAIASYGYSHGWLGGCGVGYEGGQLCGDTAGLLAVTQQQTDTNATHPAQVMLSHEGANYAVAVSHQRNGTTEVAGNYSFGAITVGAGYTNVFGGDAWTLSTHYDGGSWGVGAIYADVFQTGNWSISANADIYGGSLYGYIGEIANSATYGLSYGYDLGGGATLTAGAEHWDAGPGVSTASVGVSFTF